MTAAAPAYRPTASWTAVLAELPGLELLWHEPLARHTTFRVGGPVTCLVRPRSQAALLALLAWLRGEQVPHFLLGAGSNLLAADEGWDGVAVQLTQCCNQIHLESLPAGAAPGTLRVGAGVKLARLLRFCMHHGLSGLEPLIGIPGTVGGALAMNAGTAEGCISEVVDVVTMVDGSGELRVVDKSQLPIGYRSMGLADGDFILEAVLHLQSKPREELRLKVRNTMRRRRETQPLTWPSAGCVFKNPPGHAAGALIDRVGLKGLRSGDAQISSRHANWIINLGRATARDILALVQIAEERVYQEFGVRLDREIKVLTS